MISFRGIYKSFGEKQVLKGVDLVVYRGETLVILGRSGTGKTVFTSMLVGLMDPDAGAITVDGLDLTKLKTDADWHDLRLRTGYLFQGSALYDSMTVGENVAFPMAQHTKMKDAEISRRVTELLGKVDLRGVEDLAPASLSGGMQRRAALARSLALDPQIIVYDEPTAGLDPITGDEIGRLVRHMQKTLQVTSIVVTHDLRLAEMVSDRLVLLFQGNIVFEGAFDEFMQSSHPEVRRFLLKDDKEETSS